MAKALKDFLAAAKASVEEISTADVEEKLGDSVLLLDVREPGELQKGFLPGALNIPRGLLELKADLEFPMREPKLTDRDQEIVIYCASGGRSLLAAATLQDMGFTHVTSMACGFGGWQQEGREIIIS
jgi:rhodanese-related sulfurtransferase